MNEPLKRLVRRAASLQNRGMACLLVQTHGSTPQTAGALMLVDDAANTWGTIGGGCVEADTCDRAVEMLARGGSGLLKFVLDRDDDWKEGLVCGGTVEVALAPLPEADELDRIVRDVEARRPTAMPLRVETEAGAVVYRLHLPPPDRLYVVGAGHVGQALARLGASLEFEVTMFDDRAGLLDRYAPEGVARAPGDVAASLRAAPIDQTTYCVLVTRGPGFDSEALEAIVGRGAKYVGMIGSRRKAVLLFDDLRANGAPPEALDAVHSPVGLDIGAVTVEEIAVAIAAQLVECRRTGATPLVEGPMASATP